MPESSPPSLLLSPTFQWPHPLLTPHHLWNNFGLKPPRPTHHPNNTLALMNLYCEYALWMFLLIQDIFFTVTASSTFLIKMLLIVCLFNVWSAYCKKQHRITIKMNSNCYHSSPCLYPERLLKLFFPAIKQALMVAANGPSIIMNECNYYPSYNQYLLTQS